MDNPLEQPAPDDPIERVHAFARDLAWGAVNEKWESVFDRKSLDLARVEVNEDYYFASKELIALIKGKWVDEQPSIELLRSFDYLAPAQNNLVISGDSRRLPPVPSYLLTTKAFSLLEKPAIPPEIFISYRQAESSAFASLIEARLTLADASIGIFIDKLIEGGAKWLKRIELEVRQCDTFIIVYGPDTPNSKTIPLEIAWAEETDSNIIPVLHHGFTRECEGYPERFKDLNDIAVEKESAEAYELAILKLLNTLGYPTLQSPHPSVEN